MKTYKSLYLKAVRQLIEYYKNLPTNELSKYLTCPLCKVRTDNKCVGCPNFDDSPGCMGRQPKRLSLKRVISNQDFELAAKSALYWSEYLPHLEARTNNQFTKKCIPKKFSVRDEIYNRIFE